MYDTKTHIANGFLILAKHTAPDKITVVDICRQSNVSRETFYYHFEDKYDLFKWLYRQSLTERIRKYSGEYSWSLIIEKAMNDAAESSAYFERLIGKSSLEYSEITYEILYEFYRNELSKNQPSGRLSEDIEAAIFIYLKGGIEYFKHYCNKHSDMSYKKMSKFIANAMPEKLSRLWEDSRK